MKRLKDYIIENYDDHILEADDDLSLDDTSGEDDSSNKDDNSDDQNNDEDNASDENVDNPDDSKDDKKDSGVNRADIKFTIWKAPDEKVTQLDDNENYQKIEYKLEDKEQGLSIDFLLGFKESSWQLWIGKIGSCSYDDDPYYSFNTNNFKKAIVMSIDKIEEFILKVKDDPENYVQFYIHK